MAYNASQTKSPVTYNLDETDWEFMYQNYTFSFSTMAHRDKFAREVEKRVQWLNDSMTRRFHVPCSFTMLAAVQLYMQIEGRGFRVHDANEGVIYRSPMDMWVFCDIAYNMDSVYSDVEEV